MIPNTKTLVNKNLGSSLSLPAHGWVGARATFSLAAHLALRNTAPNSAEKKGSQSEGVAEGGGWGEEFRHARAEVRQQADKLRRFRRPAVGGTPKQNNFQFLLRKIWRASEQPIASDFEKSLSWSGMRDLNSRPQRPERCALPGCANPRYFSLISV